MIIRTHRLVLRPWQESDADDLFKYAADPRIGPAAGWPVHTDAENSRSIIKNVLMVPETYAIALPDTHEAIGSIGLKFGEQSSLLRGENQAELGYWLGYDHWGKGYVPECAMALLEHGFITLGLDTIWCGCYDGNENSRRVQAKCGFKYSHSNENTYCPLLGEYRTEHISLLTRDEFIKTTRRT